MSLGDILWLFSKIDDTAYVPYSRVAFKISFLGRQWDWFLTSAFNLVFVGAAVLACFLCFSFLCLS